LAAGIVGAARLGITSPSHPNPTPTSTAQVTMSVPTSEGYTPTIRRTTLPDRRNPVRQPVPFPFVTAVGPTPCEPGAICGTPTNASEGTPTPRATGQPSATTTGQPKPTPCAPGKICGTPTNSIGRTPTPLPTQKPS